ncbi:hypothetical protein [Sorangium sp. So ce1000]|uniref:hypothetical protein n=1 Tax=Sorangium sp. So ce1000 TaxID=3133325 RepID=UPI003F633AF6
MRLRHDIALLTVLALSLAACGDASLRTSDADADLEEEAPELSDVEDHADPEALAAPEQTMALSSSASCAGLYPPCRSCGPDSCGQTCCAHEREPGFEIWYEDDCYAWVRPSWQRKSAPGLICHLDTDVHWNKVTIEVHVADPYEDVSCVHFPDSWSKYEKDETSCSFFTSESECARRVQEEVMSVAAQGYIPTFTARNEDQCPYPRL